MKKRISQFAPWIIALIIVFFLFKAVPPQDIWKAVTLASIPLFALYAVLYFFIMLLWDCFTLKLILSRFVTAIDFGETILMRGATYLLMILNYNLGQGGIAFYLKRTHGAPIFKTLGSISFISLLDLFLVITTTVVAVSFADVTYRGVALRPIIFNAASIFYAIFFGWTIFWKLQETALLRKLRQWRWVEYIVNRPLFFVYREATLGDYARFLALRAPMIFFVNISTLLWLNAFHSWVPVDDLMTYNPIILMVGTLPITPSGLGAIQVLAIEFYQNIISSPLIAQGLLRPEDILTAMTLMAMFFNITLKALFGFFCLRRKSKDLFMEVPDDAS